jgi:hypothetical protein
MTTPFGLTPAKRKHLLKTFGACPSGSITKELAHLLDLLYGMFSYAYTLAKIRQIMISNRRDRSETSRQFKLVDFTDWLEALVL